MAAGGEEVSRPGFATAGWHRATVPTTVVSALVADGTYPDPYDGMNLRQIPGTTYRVGTNFSNVPMPDGSPFAVPWWYRAEFTLPAGAAGRTLWLRLEGVNFKFDAWLNGKKIADAAETAGAFRLHELDVTGAATPGVNALRRARVRPEADRPRDHVRGLESHAPRQGDGALSAGDARRRPGPVALRHPQVVTKLNPPANDQAELTVKVFATNATKTPVTGTLKGAAAGVAFQKDVALAAGETREIAIGPKDVAGLALANPKLWWPAQVRRAGAARRRSRDRGEGRGLRPPARAVRHPRVRGRPGPERPRVPRERPARADPGRGLGRRHALPPRPARLEARSPTSVT